MAVRVLMMIAMMVLELGCGIAGILGVHSLYPRQRLDEGGIAGVVMIVVAIVIAWLLTIAFFVRKTSRARAVRLVEEAKVEAGRILGEATERAMALCSLDAGRCKGCGNPRTGRFCPQCGAAGEKVVNG